jgi:drug/metabolite transporter (DMT)-like permease
MGNLLGGTMSFFKEHVTLRITLMIVFFVVGMLLLITGWHMTSKLSGLGLMLIGVVFLLTTLFVYNKAFETLKRREEVIE